MKRITIIMALFLIILVGCNKDIDETANNEQTNIRDEASLSLTDFAERTITLHKKPEKIVALGNGETDIIYALGEQVVGRPTGDTIVPEAQDALEVGSSHSIDIEKITSLDPDVVLGNNPMNINDVQTIESIDSEMILTNANSIEDIQKQVNLFGELVENKEKAKEINEMIDDKIATIQSTQDGEKIRVLLIYGAPGTNMAALPNSLGGNILELAGGENIASDYPSLDMYPQYAQLNTERIIESNPQIILLMSHGNPEEVKSSFEKEMSSAAGWNELDAVKNEEFHILPSDLFGTNPGTQIVDALDYLDELLQDVKE